MPMTFSHCKHWVKRARRSIVYKLLAVFVVGLFIYGHSNSFRLNRSPVSLLDTVLINQDFSTQSSEKTLASDIYQKYKYGSEPTWVDKYTLRRNLLTIKRGALKGSSVSGIEDLSFYDSDPRLSWTVYLNHIMGFDDSYSSELFSHVKIPFSWYDWADFSGLNNLISVEHTPLRCSIFYGKSFDLDLLQDIENEIGDFLFASERLRYNDPKWYQSTKIKKNEKDTPPNDLSAYCKQVDKAKFGLPVEITKLHAGVRPEVYELQARAYLLSRAAPPLSISIMEKDLASYRFDIHQNERKNMIQSGILSSYLKEHADEQESKGDILFDHVATFEKFLDSRAAMTSKVTIPDTATVIFEHDLVHLTPEDFEIDVHLTIERLEKLKADDQITSHDLQYLESLQNSVATPPSLAPKYFSEAGKVKQFSNMGYHRDEKFFKGALIYDIEEYQLRLNSLIRNWLKFTKANGLITWLAHGTAYGYLYNGKTFPWDNDFDVQMPIRHLHLLSRYFNQSLIVEDPREGNGKFFVDVTSTITTRIKGNGYNNIDARFVDVDSGLYIDITGLSVSSAPVTDKFYGKFKNEKDHIELEKHLKNFKYPEKGDNLAALDPQELALYVASHEKEFKKYEIKKVKIALEGENKIKTQSPFYKHGISSAARYIINRELKVYNCRNNHFVSLDLLSPLYQTLYHGSPAFIPRRTIDVLNNEYRVPKNWGFQVFQGKAFFPALRSWFNFNVLKRFANVNSWHPRLETLKSPVSDLNISDVEHIYKNMLKLGYTDLFAITYSSFNVTAYRLKELEIQYDDTFQKDERLRMLRLLRTAVGPNVSSPGKDPYIFIYERNLWQKFSSSLGKSTSQEVQAAVEDKVLRKLWLESQRLHDRDYELFKVRDSEGSVVHDLGKIGKPLALRNAIFEADPSL